MDGDVTPPSDDAGLDVIAERDGVRLGVQAKAYGSGGRRVNAQAVRELFGAAACLDCTESMIATNGELLPEALATAAKLGVEVRAIASPSRDARSVASEVPLSFSAIWEELVIPLAGRTVTDAKGNSNQIVSVDGGRLVRRTSSGGKQPLPIEIFRWTIERLLDGEIVTRKEINDRLADRGSSGVVRILASLDPFERTTVDGRMALCLASGAA